MYFVVISYRVSLNMKYFIYLSPFCLKTVRLQLNYRDCKEDKWKFTIVSKSAYGYELNIMVKLETYATLYNSSDFN